MAKYKDQHYLPAAYLGQFGYPAETKLRRRKIWRVSKERSHEVPVISQCKQKWFYSKDHAPICEKYFGEIETVYACILAKLIRGKKLNRDELFILFLCAIDFVARGWKYQADSEGVRFGYYLMRIQSLKSLIFKKLEDKTDDIVREFILERWDFKVFSFPEDQCLLTSDFPTLLFGHSLSPNLLKGLVLPITPCHCFTAVSTDCYRLSDRSLSEDDSATLNLNQIDNALRNVYSPCPVDSKTRSFIQKKIREESRVCRDEKGWEVEFVDYNENPTLSLIISR